MSLRLVLRRIAQRELDEAADWYEERCAGLGREFIEEIDATLACVSAYPEQFAFVHRDIREALVRRFPFAIYFRSSCSPSCTLLEIPRSGAIAARPEPFSLPSNAAFRIEGAVEPPHAAHLRQMESR